MLLLLFFLLLLLLLMKAGTDVQFGGVPTEHQLHCTLILLLLDFPDTFQTRKPTQPRPEKVIAFSPREQNSER